jgi:hypothetical protein
MSTICPRRSTSFGVEAPLAFRVAVTQKQGSPRAGVGRLAWCSPQARAQAFVRER